MYTCPFSRSLLHPSSDPHVAPSPPATAARQLRPFAGDVRGASWNAGGLWCYDARKQHAKLTYVETLMAHYDFLMVQETHSSPTGLAAWRGMHGVRYFACHGQHGVGIFVTEAFLNQFDNGPPLDEVALGRLAILRLHGANGALDLGVWYAPYRQCTCCTR